MKEDFFLNTMQFTQVHTLNGISDGSAVFVGLKNVRDRPTNRQTDRATPVIVGCIYMVVRCDLIISVHYCSDSDTISVKFMMLFVYISLRIL